MPLLKKHNEIYSPKHSEVDITKSESIVKREADICLNLAAFTDVQGAEINREQCFEVNVVGVFNLIEAYPDVPIVYISSEYAKNPVNFYALTKQMAEELLMYRGNCLIIRTLFKPKPWKWEFAFIDQLTQGGYITDVAPRIEEAIESWDRKGKSLIYIGDGKGRKTIFDLAKETKADVKPNSVKDMAVSVPADYL